MRPGSLGISAGWAIALTGAGIASVIAYKTVLGSIAAMGLVCFASTFLSRSSKSAGLGIVFVSNILFTVLVALVIRSQADAAIDESLAQSGDTSALAQSAGDTVGFLAMIVGAAVASVPAFVVSLIGSLMGVALRPRPVA